MNVMILRNLAISGAVAATALLQSGCVEYYRAERRPYMVYDSAAYGAPAPGPAPVYQTYPQGPQVYTPAQPQTVAYQRLTEAQIDQLTAPIALYPDPLLGQLLPAATFPNDILAAQQWLQQH